MISPESADTLRILFIAFVILLVFGAGRGGRSRSTYISTREIIMKWKKDEEERKKK